jgi:hypothetical protein
MLLGIPYDGKICFDWGMNSEKILITLKAAANWKDCYKNLILTLVNWSNWFGPKAMLVDYCDFHTDEDLLIYSYNPPYLNANTGDLSLFAYTDYYVSRTNGAWKRRPASGDANFYRDCVALDDSLFYQNSIFLQLRFLIESFAYIFNIDINRYLPKRTDDGDTEASSHHDLFKDQEETVINIGAKYR